MRACQPFVVVSALKEHALIVHLSHVGDLLLDVHTVAIVARGLGAVVGVAAGAVPVALDGLRRQVDLHVEVLGSAHHDLAREPELVAHVDAYAGPDLHLPLPAHHFRVGARDREAGLQTVDHDSVRELAADRVFAADRAVVGALRLRLAVGGEAERPGLAAVERHHAVLLLHAEPGLLAQVGVEDLLGLVAHVGAVGHAHGQVLLGLAHDHDVRCAAEGVGHDLDGQQEDFRVVAGGLLGGAAVEVPGRAVLEVFGRLDRGAVVQHLGLGAQFHFAAQPDVLRQHDVVQFVFFLLEFTH